MADKILMNKNTLAQLKLELKEYKTALPVFEMKEQQLKKAIQVVEQNIAKLSQSIEATNTATKPWAAVMAEDGIDIDLKNIVNIDEVTTKTKEIAGVTVEEFKGITFNNTEIDMFNTPLWLDSAVSAIQDQKTDYAFIAIEKRNLESIHEELAEARRMKNALKEVFIPETKNNIRKIEIYLGDVERLAIGCAKLVKKKKQDKKATA